MWNSSPPSEEAEEFYESLDRILSSSCSSTSASDDEASGGDHRLHHHRRLHRPPSFPPPVACSYDVWIAEPSSVEERRRRLLQQLGLIGDPALSRNRTTVREANGGPPEAGPSTSSRTILSRPDGTSLVASASAVSVMGRSRSDGSVDPSHANKEQLQRRAVSFGSDTSSKPSGEGDSGGFQLRKQGSGDGDCHGQCTIRNLDDGSEFVVKEIREDGMWNKLREVGTGRQFTMEEFEMCVGRSPIVQELMRRQNIEEAGGGGDSGCSTPRGDGAPAAGKSKKKGSWFKSIRSIAGTVVAGGHHRDRRAGDEKDGSSERGGARRSSSATDDSLDGFHSLLNGPERIRVRQYGKSCKELSGLYITQEIQSHDGAIWTMKFSPDGRHLATAGVDCVIHVREVSGFERNGESLPDEGAAVGENGNCYSFLAAISSGSPTQQMALNCIEGNQWEKRRRAKIGNSRRSVSSDHLMVPEHVFALSEKPICSFSGHTEDVLDLSWSKSQYLLSSSMDKTVRLWCLTNSSCLKIFSHSDYVTCIQFNPVDDRYFISGSLDEKVRLWNIPNRQIVDWHDIHEMITAACFTPDGREALVGTHKGGCHMFDTSENKLHFKSQIDLQNKKKKSNHKKITGFQFAPGSFSEVLITSADSRIRVVNGVDLVHKFKGFRNTSSQISASLSPNGKYVICASEDSYVYMWRYDADTQPSRMKGIVNVTQSYENFHCQDVTVAITWPGAGETGPSGQNQGDSNSDRAYKIETGVLARINGYDSSFLPVHRWNGSPRNSHNVVETSSTWPEERPLVNEFCHQNSVEFCNGATQAQGRSAWGMTIVTAGRGGEIRAFQNFGFPFRV